MNQGLGSKVAAIVAVIFLAALPALAAAGRVVQLASGDVPSGLFALAGAVATAVNSGAERVITLSPQPSASADAALSKLRSGVVDMALVPDSAAYMAYKGMDDRRYRANPQLRTLAHIAQNPLFILVRADRTVTSIAGLTGWRIALGPRGTDASANMADLLGVLGLPGNSYQAVAADLDASPADLIRTNQADAVLVNAAQLPAPEVTALTAGTLRLLSPGKAELAQAVATFPFLTRRMINPGTGDNYATLSSGAALMVRANMPASLLTSILERLWSKTPGTNRSILDPNHAASNVPAPLHDGALAYYQDNKMMETEDGQ